MRLRNFRMCLLVPLACSDGPTSPSTGTTLAPTPSPIPTPAPPAAASRIEVSPDSQSVAVRSTAVFTAVVKDAAGNELKGRVLTWASSDTSIASINSTTGVLTTIAPGLVTVTAKADGVSGASKLLVRAGSPAKIAVFSGNNQTALPGTPVAVPPAALVTDADGNAVAGISVSFAVTSGGGSVAPAAVITNGGGVAQVASWTLGPVAGANGLTATGAGMAPVTFTATSSLASGAASISKVAGDNQTGPTGDALPVPPGVIVRDNQGNPVAGVTVNFSVQNGTVANISVPTNAAGVANSGEWRLGGAVGSANVTASVAGLASVAFSASVVAACGWAYAMEPANTRLGDFQQFDCGGPTGPLRDAYLINLTAGSFTFRVASLSGNVNSVLELYSLPGVALIARNDDEVPASNHARFRAILPAGSYRAVAATVAAGQAGGYSLSVAPSTESVTGCELVYVAPGTATTQSLSTTDCVDTLAEGNYYEDRYLRTLVAGEQLTVSMSSTALDAYLIVADAAGKEIAFNDDKATGTTDAELTFTAPAAGLYMIRASSSLVAQQGGYSLIVR